MTRIDITTIIFDAGGVLLYYKRRRSDIVRGILTAMGYDPYRIELAINKGEEYDIDYFKKNKWIFDWKQEKDWLINHYITIANFTDENNEILADKLFMLTFDTNEYALYSEVIGVLEKLKGRYKLGVISNANPSLDWAFTSLHIRQYFDDIVISAYEGIAKPDEEIYIKSIKNLGSKVEECLFIDDRMENVQVAERLGMKGFCLDRHKDYTLQTVISLLDKYVLS